MSLAVQLILANKIEKSWVHYINIECNKSFLEKLTNGISCTLKTTESRQESVSDKKDQIVLIDCIIDANFSSRTYEKAKF